MCRKTNSTNRGVADARRHDGCFSRASTDVVGTKYNFEVRNTSIGAADGAKKAVEPALAGDKVPGALCTAMVMPSMISTLPVPVRFGR
jgi:hypothetical protein